MRLWINGTSPYARLCRVTAAEKNLPLELRWTDPWSDPADFIAVAPSGKIPVLELENGVALTESSVIVDVLDRMGGGRTLAPADDRAAARLGLARALTDCAFGAVVLRRFHGGDEPPAPAGRWAAGVRRILTALESGFAGEDPVAASREPDLAGLTLGVALAYLQLRYPTETPGPKLTAFAAATAARPAFAATPWTA